MCCDITQLDPTAVRSTEVATGKPLRTSIHLPIVVGGMTRAVLALALPHRLEADALHLLGLLEALAAQTAAAFTRDDLLDHFREQARTDPLTGAANRRVWDEQLTTELTRSQRLGSPLSVAVLGPRPLQSVHDTQGHAAGDQLLRNVTTRWQASLRQHDLLARLGGEEFAVLLPDTSLANAALTLERLREATPSGVTVSAGLTQQQPGDTPDTIYARADSHLYRAKALGRDQLHLDPATRAA